MKHNEIPPRDTGDYTFKKIDVDQFIQGDKMKVLSDEQMGKLLEDYPLSYKSPSGEPNSIGAIYKRVEERNKAIAQAQLQQDKKDIEACIDGVKNPYSIFYYACQGMDDKELKHKQQAFEEFRKAIKREVEG